MSAKPRSIQLRPGHYGYRLTTIASAIVPSIKPRLQTTLFRMMYSIIGAGLKNDNVAFLNYGYAPLDSSSMDLDLHAKDEAERVLIQLYFRVAGALDLRGKDVLEIGCGRGGGASFIARYLHPASMTGVDLADRAVQYCRQNHRVAGLTFVRGEAGNLPLPASSYDAVVNVESSHCYPSFEGFLSEVARVLRPNGSLLFADFRPRGDVANMREQLQQWFTLIEEESITPNVVRALELDSDRRNLIVQKRAPRFLQESLKTVAAVKGSSSFNAFATGDLQYLRFVMQKRP